MARPRRGRKSRRLWLSAFVCSALGSACVPEFDEGLSRVTELRILALQVTPAQAGEGEPVVFQPLIASSYGTAANDDVVFAFCLERKPLSELGPVSPACLLGEDEALEGLGHGNGVEANVPEDACSLFGPRRPDPEPGQPAGRPVDPDLTGGYHQPIIAQLPGERAILGGIRLDCGLPGATREQAAEYTQRYRPNANVELIKLELRRAGQWQTVPTAEVETTRLSVKRGAELRLRVSWPKCETDNDCTAACTSDENPSCLADCTAAEHCNGAERYLRYDAETRSLVEQQEEMVASWFASGGEFLSDRSGPTSKSASSAENHWFAPSDAGTWHLWVVLRDGRGGVGFGSYTLDVE